MLLHPVSWMRFLIPICANLGYMYYIHVYWKELWFPLACGSAIGKCGQLFRRQNKIINLFLNILSNLFEECDTDLEGTEPSPPQVSPCISTMCTKGVWHEIFNFRFSSWISFPRTRWVSQWGRFKFLRKFAAIFTILWSPVSTTAVVRCSSKNNTGDELSPVSLLSNLAGHWHR